jgi:hypothetical protein
MANQEGLPLAAVMAQRRGLALEKIKQAKAGKMKS